MLSEARVIEDARRRTGLYDYGDESFRDGLSMLILSANKDARFTDKGEAAYHSSLVFNLSNRLHVEGWYRRHPEIEEQDVGSPLFGLGLPRTGSTALGCTLAEDPEVRSIRTWEVSTFDDPCYKENALTDPRIAAFDAAREAYNRTSRMGTMVPVGALTQVECHVFMGLDFKAQEFVARARIPGYVDWILNEADLVSTYRYMKRAMKLMQWRQPNMRWRLKSPSHMPFINALNEVFPEARFWMTHRDVTKVFPSVVDVYHELHKMLTDHVDPEFIVGALTQWLTTGLHRLIEFRDNGHDHRFVDVKFEDFQRDPVSVVETIYAFLGEELTEEARRKMQVWREEQARGKHGAHVLDTIAAGLDLDKIRNDFRFYTDRYSKYMA